MNQKHYQNIFRVIVDMNLMVGKVMYIKSGIQKSANVSVKINKTLCM